MENENRRVAVSALPVAPLGCQALNPPPGAAGHALRGPRPLSTSHCLSRWPRRPCPASPALTSHQSLVCLTLAPSEWILSRDCPAVISDFTSTAPRLGPSQPASHGAFILVHPLEKPPTVPVRGLCPASVCPKPAEPSLRVSPPTPQSAPIGTPGQVVLPRSSETFPATAFPCGCFVHVAHPFPARGVLGTIHVSVFKLQTRRTIERIHSESACKAIRTVPALPTPRPAAGGSCAPWLSPHMPVGF